MSVRSWPDDFPEAVAVERRAPYESRADSVMYFQWRRGRGGSEKFHGAVVEHSRNLHSLRREKASRPRYG